MYQNYVLVLYVKNSRVVRHTPSKQKTEYEIKTNQQTDNRLVTV